MRHCLRRSGGARGVEEQERIARIGRRVIGGQGRGGFQLGERVGGVEEQPGAAVREDRLDLGAAVGHVQRAHHRAEARDGEVDDEEFRRVRQLDGDHVARANTLLAQAICHIENAIVEPAPGEDAGR